MAETNKGLFIKRYATLKEHQAAVKLQNEKKRIAGNQKPKEGKDAINTINRVLRGQNPSTKATPSKSTPTNPSKTTTSKPKTTPTPKPTAKGDGSVTATPRKTSYQQEVEKRNKLKRAIDGVGPSDKDRKKNSSPAAMSQKPKEGSYKTVSGQKYIYKAGKWRKIGKYSMDQKG